METESAAGFLFCRPRLVAQEGNELNGGRIVLLVVPFIALLAGLAFAARRAGERGDVETVTLMLWLATGLFCSGYVLPYIVIGAIRRRELSVSSPPLATLATVRFSDRRIGARGVLSLEDGALAFYGDAFDFRLPPEILPSSPRADHFIGLKARKIPLPLPNGFGGASLWLLVEERDRPALTAILEGLTPGAEPVLPPLYRLEAPVKTRGAWWVVVFFTFLMGVVAVVVPGRGDPLPLLISGPLIGWAFGPGLVLLDRSSLGSSERAFRKLQARDLTST